MVRSSAATTILKECRLGGTTRCCAALPLGARAQHRQRAPRERGREGGRGRRRERARSRARERTGLYVVGTMLSPTDSWTQSTAPAAQDQLQKRKSHAAWVAESDGALCAAVVLRVLLRVALEDNQEAHKERRRVGATVFVNKVGLCNKRTSASCLPFCLRPGSPGPRPTRG